MFNFQSLYHVETCNVKKDSCARIAEVNFMQKQCTTFRTTL